MFYLSIATMNISVYLPDNLKSRLESYISMKGITKNAAIRNAIELLLKQEKNASWGAWMDNFKGDPAFKSFESNRSALEKPRQDIF